MSRKSQSVRKAPKVDRATEAAPVVRRSKAPIVLVVLAIFLGLIAVKLLADGTPVASGGAPSGTSITSVRNDAVADYDAAVATGKPIYLLFHSLTCEPCVEISAVADQVMPEYADDVVFVNAITDDPSGQQLTAQFSFQYIPTSFFLSPGGENVVDSYTGAMDAAAMRTYLDALVQVQ